VKDGRGGVVEHFGVKQSAGIAGDFETDHLRRAGNAFAIREPE
jgi:hypothetical protein